MAEITVDLDTAATGRLKRQAKPTLRFRLFLEEQATTGQYEDIADELGTPTPAELAVLDARHPGVSRQAAPAAAPPVSVSALLETMRAAVKDIRHHHVTRQQFVAQQAAVDKRALTAYEEQTALYDERLARAKKAALGHRSDEDSDDPSDDDGAAAGVRAKAGAGAKVGAGAADAGAGAAAQDLIRPSKPALLRGLITDIPTRWNSTLHSLCSVIENSEPIDALWSQLHGHPLYDDAEWRAVESVASFLDQFDVLTNRLQGVKVLASEALLAVAKFQELTIIAPHDPPAVVSLKGAICAHLANHRAKLSRILGYLDLDSLSALCACIDPRMAHLSFFNVPGDARLSAARKDEIVAHFLNYGVAAIENWQERKQRYEASSSAASEPLRKKPAAAAAAAAAAAPAVTAACAHDRSGMYGSWESAAAEDASVLPVVVLKDTLRIELKSFCNKAQRWCQSSFAPEVSKLSVDKQTDAIFAWWRSIAHELPNLRIVAAKLFSVRLTTASVERLFSFAGLVKTALRNRMSPELFDALVCYAYTNPTLQQGRAKKAERRNR